jgi:CheY-like chemotaxis protein
MSPQVIARVFDPFFTTKPLGVGTGLGLSMVHGFTRQSGGQVQIRSNPGRGTTVSIYLPRHGTQTDAAPAQPLLRRPVSDPATVLVADDEAGVRALVTQVLTKLGYASMQAVDGFAALAILQSASRIDLLITDVGMPGMNGRHLADAARIGRPDLKVLFITGYSETMVTGNGDLLPGMHLMTKPFTLKAIANRITSVLSGP